MNKIALFGDSTCDLTPELRKEHDIDYVRMLVNWTDKDKKNHDWIKNCRNAKLFIHKDGVEEV